MNVSPRPQGRPPMPDGPCERPEPAPRPVGGPVTDPDDSAALCAAI